MADQFTFGGTGADLTPSEGGNRPTQPYIGKATLVEVNGNPPSDKPEKRGFKVLQFLFRLDEGPEAGTVHRHIEWEPQNQDKATNSWKRVGHILSQFVKGDKENAKEAAAQALLANNWDEFREKVLNIFNQQMGQSVYSAKQDLQIKLLGWIQKEGAKAGQTDYGFPGYLGFIGDSRSEKPLTFSPTEQAANAQYLQALSNPPAARQGGPTNPAFAPPGGGGTTGGAAEPLQF